LDTIVARMVVIGSVPIFFSIGFIVFLLVGNQIVECESVVRGYEIDAGGRAASIALIKITAACQSVAKLGELAVVTLPVAPHYIAVTAVPFRPQRRKLPNLISAIA